MRLDLQAIAAAAAHDPAQALFDAAGDLSDYDVFHNIVLVALYVSPPRLIKRDDGTIYEFQRSDGSLAEDRFQAKCGLVLGTGPLAFKDDATAKFGGKSIKRGDWVTFRKSNGTELFIRDRRYTDKGLACLLIEDTFVQMSPTDPSLIY